MDDEDTIRCGPPDGCAQEPTPDFYARLLAATPRDAGTRRPTTWQQDHQRDPRFNARGCR